jgi:HipA-like protein
MKELSVIFLGKPVGLLRQEVDGRMTFRYDAAYLANEGARPLSQSLPLREEVFTERECAPFFGGLLPEEQNREIVARNLGITPRNDYAMLREIGGECAGAVSLIPADEAPKEGDPSYEPVSEEELIGNHDAHGKNFSLLYLPEGDRVQVRLAPFYDLISTAIYPELTPKMAMKIGFLPLRSRSPRHKPPASGLATASGRCAR